jgi:hypothetical protein
MLMGMLHMPTLVSSTGADSPLMFSSPPAADGFGQPAHAAMSSGTADSQMDAVHSDAAAAQLLESQAGLTLAAQEAALNQLKKACKAAKSEQIGAKLYFQMSILASAAHTVLLLAQQHFFCDFYHGSRFGWLSLLGC